MSRFLPHIDPSLARAHSRGVFSTLDVQFASRLGALFGESSPDVMWGLALACRQEAQGHVCADLPALDERGLVSDVEGESIVHSSLPEGVALESWIDALRGSPIIGSDAGADAESEPKPVVLDAKGRLFLRRNFSDQSMLATALLKRGSAADLDVDWDLAQSAIERLVPDAPPKSGARPSGFSALREALRVGLARPISFITGGPGTGKTTLVAKLIALAVEQSRARGSATPVVRLLAPTGKAAAAMTASFQGQLDALDVAHDARAALPATAETIHRALMQQTHRDALGRASSTPIEADIVVVDEASMVDMAQMRELLSACMNVERVIFLGDPDQLASIDAGAVLSEVCSIVPPTSRARLDRGLLAGKSDSPRLADSIVTLTDSYRFSSESGIGRLADAIRAGDTERVLLLLEDPAYPDVERLEIDSVSRVHARLVEAVREMRDDIEAARSLDAKLARLARGRVLCAHRGGPLGVEAVCDVLDRAVATATATRAHSRDGWWPGRLLLVTRNAPDQDLWNGDVGLVEETKAGLRALFSNPDGGVRSLSAGRLPSYESAIAISVHKSQGSEFDAVDLVLGQRVSRLMTRELLYTGVTRAREQLRIHASEDVIRGAMARRIERDSALAEKLVEPEIEA